jgi:exopolysaccharide biosynthesis protein
MRKKLSGQSVIEYFIMMALILAAILSTGFIEHIRGGFKAYFNSAVSHLK